MPNLIPGPISRDPHDPEDSAAILAMANDPEVQLAARTLLEKTFQYGYYRNFKWMGRPIIQYPQDIIALQEIVWRLRPTLVIETGVAHGGSLIFYASLFDLIGEGRVLGVELELREHNRRAISAHQTVGRIDIIEGSSVDDQVVQQVYAHARGHERIMVVLDSYHTHEHVLEELRRYSPLVSAGGSLVVFGTSVAHVGPQIDLQRPWNADRNPKSALEAFLSENDRFVVDRSISDKLILTDAPGGYLTCVADALTAR